MTPGNHIQYDAHIYSTMHTYIVFYNPEHSRGKYEDWNVSYLNVRMNVRMRLTSK